MVSRSSTEPEYRALASIAAELSWLCMLLKELKIPLHDTPTVWCDNLFAISHAANPVFHVRMKHIELDYNLIREKVLQKQIRVHYIASEDQHADMFTKSLSSSGFISCRTKLQVLPVPALKGGC